MVVIEEDVKRGAAGFRAAPLFLVEWGGMSFEASWRKVRGELPGWCAGDAGMVPLSARETAKGEEQATQLAALRQVLPVLQRSHPRAKRKPDPRIMHTSPETHRWVTREIQKECCLGAVICRGGKKISGFMWICSEVYRWVTRDTKKLEK